MRLLLGCWLALSACAGDKADDSGGGVADDSGGGVADDSGGGVECVDKDEDGYGEGCAAGPDCDDEAATCAEDCSDSDGSGQPDCLEGVGEDVFLYTGAGGGGYDISVNDLLDLYGLAGIGAFADGQLPPGMAERYGVLIVLAPQQPLPPQVFDAAGALVARGGRVVVVSEHSGYSHHEGMAALLGAIGSSMVTVEHLEAGWQVFSPSELAPLTDGVSELRMYYTAKVDAGQGEVLGVDAQGEAILAREAVGRGEVVVACDGSLFGYALNEADNARFVQNLGVVGG